MMNICLRVLGAATLLISGLAQVQVAWAQDAFPTKPITVVVAFPPGGMTDPLSRNLIGRSFQATTGQPVVVLNRPGASGSIAAKYVAGQPADGYTLLFSSSALTLDPALRPQAQIDVRKNLTPIGIVGTTPFWVVVNKDLPVRSMKELVALAKAQPGALKVGSAGVGSSNHMALELFQRITGTQFLHVPYQGSGPAKLALATGEVNVMFDTIGASGDQEAAGRIRALAISGPSRAPERPELPTMTEAGFPDFSYSVWLGLFAPAGTPKEIVRRLHTLLTQAIKAEEGQKLLFQLGTRPVDISPEEFTSVIAKDVDRWLTIVKETNLKVE
jgi:tripartite-type tricarboxylate transporter receptor subunit TctC